MEALIKNIELITELLYQQRQADAYEKLVDILPDLALVAEELAHKHNEIIILEGLKDIVQAMESNNLTLLADILSYEIADKLRDYIR